jgi:hypothetical protein
MRLPKQKLPKQIQKHAQSAKHKKSTTKLLKVKVKLAKLADKEAVSMSTEDGDADMDTEAVQLTEEEKYDAKMLRKKGNIAKNSYKRGWIKTKHIR